MRTMTLALGGSAAVVVAVGAAIMLRPVPEGAAPVPFVAPQPETEEVVVEAVPPVAEMGTDEAAPPVAEESVVQEAAAAPERVEPSALMPVTDGFRFEPDGGILLSGQADAALPLALIVDGVEVGRIDVMPDGTFLFVGDLGFSDRPRALQVVSDPEGAALAAERTYVLAANPAPEPLQLADVPEVVTAAAPDVPVVEGEVQAVVAATPMVDLPAEGGTEGEVIAQVVPEVERTAGNVSDADVTPEVEAIAVSASDVEVSAVPEEAPAAPAILAVTEQGIEVVQPPVISNVAPEVMSTVALDTITYDPDGEVILGGRAIGAGFVQVYVNNAPISRLPVDADGRWRGDLPGVDKGVYTLRIDEVDAGGAVVSRIETPFLREDPVDVVEAMADQVADPAFIVATRTVQPGATLWAIAQERYGEGVLYVKVFEANRDRIRDPDLIYPGQVFVLPEDES